jgi:hypothetical protein
MIIPGNATFFPALQTQGWAIDTAGDIGPTVPKVFTAAYVTPPVPATALLLTIQGIPGSWCDGMAQRVVQTPAGITNYVLSTTFVPPVGFVKASSAWEIGLRGTDEFGYTSNGQIQANFNNLRAGGQMEIDVVPYPSGWTNTGIILPTYQENAPHTVVQTYFRNPVTHTFSATSWTLDGQAHFIPPSLQNVPMIEMGWERNKLIIGIQPDVNNIGLWFQITVPDVRLWVW